MAHVLEQFEIHPVIPFEVFGVDVSLTNAGCFMLLAVVGAWALLECYTYVPSREHVPSRLHAFVELVYTFVERLVFETLGPRGRPFFPFVFSVFIFVALGNLLGMIPYAFTFTSHIIVTFSLAMVVFLFSIGVGFYKHGLGFLSFFVPPGLPAALWPLVVPIEIISFFSRPISLSIRLFANMMAGHTMMKVFAGFCVALVGQPLFLLKPLAVVPLAVGVALTAFEFLVALLQAYIFAVLTCLYLHDSLELH